MAPLNYVSTDTNWPVQLRYREVARQIQKIWLFLFLLTFFSGQQQRLLHRMQVNRWGLPRLDFHLAQKCLDSDGWIGILVAAQRLQEPRQWIDQIVLLCGLKLLVTPKDDCMQHFMCRKLCFEIRQFHVFRIISIESPLNLSAVVLLFRFLARRFWNGRNRT